MAFNKKDLSLALAALFPTMGTATVLSAIAAYRAIFPRHERPNYSLVPGEYLYSRIADRLPRKELIFEPHDTKLKGYYYPASHDRGTVIFRHGIHAGADDYLPLTEALVGRGYNVFTYDATGTFESEGDSTVGMCQAIIDLEATVKYLRAQDEFRKAPLYLLGHSWGAYAVTSSLCSIDGISACAAISGMNNGVNMIADKAREYVKLNTLVDFPETVFRMYQRLLFGRYVDMCAVDGINRTGIPTLVAHGIDDKTVRYKNQSIASHKESFKNGNITYYVGKGLNGGHNNIWHSHTAVAYQMEIDSEVNLLHMTNDNVTDNDLANLYATVDHRKYSAVNENLIDLIDETFSSAK